MVPWRVHETVRLRAKLERLAGHVELEFRAVHRVFMRDDLSLMRLGDAHAGSQPYHAFPAPDGTRKSREDTTEAVFEIRRALGEPPGHPRTCNQDGSGP